MTSIMIMNYCILEIGKMYSLIDGTQIVVTHTESSKLEHSIAPTFKSHELHMNFEKYPSHDRCSVSNLHVLP